jgi:hypothetical protein
LHVYVDVPVIPAADAEIVAFPAATPVATPLEETVAMAVLLLDQVNVTPDIVWPN